MWQTTVNTHYSGADISRYRPININYNNVHKQGCKQDTDFLDIPLMYQRFRLVQISKLSGLFWYPVSGNYIRNPAGFRITNKKHRLSGASLNIFGEPYTTFYYLQYVRFLKFLIKNLAALLTIFSMNCWFDFKSILCVGKMYYSVNNSLHCIWFPKLHTLL